MVKIRADILSRDLRRSQRLIEEGANRLHTRAGEVILSSLIMNSRVDKGKFVSNWRVGIGQPTRSEIPAYSPGKQGSTAAANRGAALAAGLSRIRSKKPGNEIFISNNVDYIEFVPRLEETIDNALSAGRMAIGNRKVL